jgi:hypothetical protein
LNPWQRLALCHRHGVDMRQLANFETPNNRGGFCDLKKHWRRAVFGKSSRPCSAFQDVQQCSCDGQFPGGGRAMEEKKQLHPQMSIAKIE